MTTIAGGIPRRPLALSAQPRPHPSLPSARVLAKAIRTALPLPLKQRVKGLVESTGQQRTGLQCGPTCRWKRDTPQRETQPNRHERWQPCTGSIKLIASAATSVDSTPPLSGVAAPFPATKASANAPLIAANRANLVMPLSLLLVPAIAAEANRDGSRGQFEVSSGHQRPTANRIQSGIEAYALTEGKG